MSGSRPLDAPILLGRYELLERIGIGGMAEVFRARLLGPEGFQKVVVIKRALPHVAEERLGVRMFVEEAKLAASIAHDGIAQVYELGRSDDGQLFIAMEHVDGVDLSRVLVAAERRALRIPPWLSVYVAAEVLDALAYVHELTDEQGRPRGIVHRDVTPSNVIISFLGKIKLSDFGIAQFAGKSPTTMAGQIKGKPSYMSPEQLASEPLDRRSDLFAVGVWLWECLTQRRLFSKKDQFALVLEIAEGARKTPSSIARDVPESLDPIVLKALAGDRNDRHANAREMRAALLAVLHQLHPNVEREQIARTIAALLGRIEPSREISAPMVVPQSLRDTSFVIELEDREPEPPPPVPARPRAKTGVQDNLEDLDTLTGPRFTLRRRGKSDRPLLTWEATFQALDQLAREGTPPGGELTAERGVSMRVEEFSALAGIDVASSDAMLDSNITIVGSIITRNIIATMAVLARDRASGTLAAARTDPVTGEWYELIIREGQLTRIMTNVLSMQLPAIIDAEGLANEDEVMALLLQVLKTRRPIEQLLRDRSKRTIDTGWLQRLRLAELFRWPNGDYTFNGSVPRAVEKSAIAAPLFKSLHAILTRALDEKTLAARIGERDKLRFFRSWRFEHAIVELDLDREERAFAERLAAGTTIERALTARAKPEDAHRLLALAYVLLEADLLLIGSA
jgi:serine/threonine protein kinase